MMHKTFSKKTEYGLPIASSADFLNLTLMQFHKAQLYVKTMQEYFWLLQVLMKTSEDVVFYLLDNHLLSRLAYLAFNNRISPAEVTEINARVPYTNNYIDIEYTDEMTVTPRKFKEEDFFKPALSDLSTFYSLIWEILSISVDPDVADHKDFVFRQPGIEYNLTPVEVKLINFNKDILEEAFESISLDNRKARQAICKIIAFSSYNSIDHSKESLKYINDELKDDKLNKRSLEYFKLISVLVKVNDPYQKKRVPFIPSSYLNIPRTT